MSKEALESIASEKMELSDEEQDKDFEAAFNGEGDDTELTEEEQFEEAFGEDEPTGGSEQGTSADDDQGTDEEPSGEDEGDEQSGGEDDDDDDADPLKDVDPRIRAAFDKLHGRVEEAEGRAAQAEKTATDATKRASGLQSALDKAVNSLDKKSGPTKDQVDEAMKSTEKMDALKEDFPEFGEAFAEGMRNNRLEILEEISEKLGETVTAEDVAQARLLGNLDYKFVDLDDSVLIDYDGLDEEQRAAIEGLENPWERLLASPEFADWFGKQSEEIQALGDSNRFRDVAKVITDYTTFRSPKDDPSNTDGDDEADKGAKEKARRRQERSVSPTGGGASQNRRSRKSKEAQDEEDFHKAFNS